MRTMPEMSRVIYKLRSDEAFSTQRSNVMYTQDSPVTFIGSTPPYNLNGWTSLLANYNSTDARLIATAYQLYAIQAGIDPSLAIAQMCLETGYATSPAWLNRRNAAGIGITSDAVLGPNFGTIDRGVQGHLELLRNYFLSPDSMWGVLANLSPPLGGFYRGYRKLSDLDGHWAVPGIGYGAHIASIANSVPVVNPPPKVDTWYIEGNPFGRIPIKEPFWDRWDALNTMGVPLDHPGVINNDGLAMPMLGYAVKAEITVDSYRWQRFERAYMVTGGFYTNSPEPWNVVVMPIGTIPPGGY